MKAKRNTKIESKQHTSGDPFGSFMSLGLRALSSCNMFNQKNCNLEKPFSVDKTNLCHTQATKESHKLRLD